MLIANADFAEAQTVQLAAAAQQLQQSLHDRESMLQVTQQNKQAAMLERDAMRAKVEQQKSELTQGELTAQELRGAAADLVDELQAVRSASGRHAGQHTALRELPAEHAACLKELAAKSAAVDSLNASMAQLRAELADTSVQQAQHEQDSTEQQAEFVGQVLQELQVLEAALLQKGEECDALSQQHTALKASSDSKLSELAAQLDAQKTTNQQLRQELKAQHAKHQELADKMLALDAQAAYKQHKLDAMHKEATTASQSKDNLQAELVKVQEQLTRRPQTTEASTSTSEELSKVSAQRHSAQEPTGSAQEQFGDEQACARQDTDAAQQQPLALIKQNREHSRVRKSLLPEADAKPQAEAHISMSEQPKLAAVQMPPYTSTEGVQRLQGQVVDLQSKLLAATAQQESLQQQLAHCMQELDASNELLMSRQLAAESLEQRLTQAESEWASAQAQQQWSQQAAADRQTLLDLQHQLTAAQEDKAALLALPQPDVAAASNLELQRAEEAVRDLAAKLADRSKEVQSLKAAAQVADADSKYLLDQLQEAQQEVAAAEHRLEQLSNAAAVAAQEQLQEQLQQDRDTLMEEVLSAKARAADQERIIQSLRVAAEASAREMALLANQLDATEQQFASQAQELLQQQREAQRLHAALKDQSMHLKKAQFKGSSNDQGLRGMQQRLQEALQDKRAAELQVQSMQNRLHEEEHSLSQVRCHCAICFHCQFDRMQLQRVPNSSMPARQASPSTSSPPLAPQCFLSPLPPFFLKGWHCLTSATYTACTPQMKCCAVVSADHSCDTLHPSSVYQ